MIDIAWSPNNLKLAVASSDRSIYLFDENGAKRDRFSTKPVDSKVPSSSITHSSRFLIDADVDINLFHSLAKRAT